MLKFHIYWNVEWWITNKLIIDISFTEAVYIKLFLQWGEQIGGKEVNTKIVDYFFRILVIKDRR